jgi:hypothetical protein
MEYDEEQISELNEKISGLLTMVQEKDSTVTTLQNKISSLTTLLNIMTEEVTTINEEPKKRIYRPTIQTLAKREFYKIHKNDPEVEKDIELFKQTFPDVKTPPWHLRKSITDRLFHISTRE